MSERPLLVVKFGGTCVADADARRAASETVRGLAAAARPVVVVSAPGRAGSPYATDTLLELGRESVSEGDPAELDALASCGEIISAALLALCLQGLGLQARSLTGARAGIRTDGRWGRARITGVDPSPLMELVSGGVVPVVAGFQGEAEGRLATLGRGGSDLTAVALAAALRAPALILTDVDGVYSADPRLVRKAHRLPSLSYEDAALLAYRGAKVLHPRAAELAAEQGIEVTIARSGDPEGGTEIGAGPPGDEDGDPVSEPFHLGGVTSLSDRYQFTVDLDGTDPGTVSLQADLLLQGLAEEGISLDMISMDEDTLRFTVDVSYSDGTRRVAEGSGLASSERGPCAKVSVVGGGMHGRPGVMARMVRALHGEGIPVLQSVDSYNVISCLIPGAREEAAVRTLHRSFFESSG
ncbi:MAG: aspartate kinase [bacterium]